MVKFKISRKLQNVKFNLFKYFAMQNWWNLKLREKDKKMLIILTSYN